MKLLVRKEVFFTAIGQRAFLFLLYDVTLGKLYMSIPIPGHHSTEQAYCSAAILLYDVTLGKLYMSIRIPGHHTTEQAYCSAAILTSDMSCRLTAGYRRGGYTDLTPECTQQCTVYISQIMSHADFIFSPERKKICAGPQINIIHAVY
jgi:hypothetical protein